MRCYTLDVVIEKEAEGEGYSAYNPRLPGCCSTGRAVEEAKGNIRDAVQQHLYPHLAHGQPIVGPS